jgi:acyl transferase domain-containing protein
MLSRVQSIAAGCNIISTPDPMYALSNLGLLSADSQSFAFDSRANGYARGEGFGVVVLKRLSDAIQNNDTIRAVIRSTGSNQDGFTTTITQPSMNSQVALMREVYAKAGLSLKRTEYFEAHGTGTQIGDTIEAKAVGEVFRKFRTETGPLPM